MARWLKHCVGTEAGEIFFTDIKQPVQAFRVPVINADVGDTTCFDFAVAEAVFVYKRCTITAV